MIKKKKGGTCIPFLLRYFFFSPCPIHLLRKHMDADGVVSGPRCSGCSHRWPAALHGQTSQLTETAGISERDVTAYNSPRIWMKKFHFFLVGFETSANIS